MAKTKNAGWSPAARAKATETRARNKRLAEKALEQSNSISLDQIPDGKPKPAKPTPKAKAPSSLSAVRVLLVAAIALLDQKA